jgi:hypothetical protein
MSCDDKHFVERSETILKRGLKVEVNDGESTEGDDARENARCNWNFPASYLDPQLRSMPCVSTS